MSDSHRCCWCNVSHGWDADPGVGPIKLHLPMAVPDDCGTAAKCAGSPMDCPGPVGGRCLGRTEEEVRGRPPGCTCSVNEWEPCGYCQRVASALDPDPRDGCGWHQEGRDCPDAHGPALEPLDVSSGLDGHRTLISRVPKGWRREGDELIPPDGWQYQPLMVLPPGPTTVQLNRESRGLLTAIKRGVDRLWYRLWCLGSKH